MAQTKKMEKIVADPQTLVWVSANRGIITKVANKVGTSFQLVSMVLYGKRKGEGPVGSKILAALKKAGAPIK